MPFLFVLLSLIGIPSVALATYDNSCSAAIATDLLKASEEAHQNLSRIIKDSAESGHFFVVEGVESTFALMFVNKQEVSILDRLRNSVFSTFKFLKRKRFLSPYELEQTNATVDSAGVFAVLSGLASIAIGGTIGYELGILRGTPGVGEGFIGAFMIFGVNAVTRANYHLREWFLELRANAKIGNLLKKAAAFDGSLGKLPLLVLQTPQEATPELIRGLLRRAGLESKARRLDASGLTQLVRMKKVKSPSVPELRTSIATSAIKVHERTGLIVENVDISKGIPKISAAFLRSLDLGVESPLNALSPTDHVNFIYAANRGYDGKPDMKNRESIVGYTITRDGRTSIYFVGEGAEPHLQTLKNLLFVTLDRPELCDPGFPKDQYAREEVFTSNAIKIEQQMRAVANTISEATKRDSIRNNDPDIFMSAERVHEIYNQALSIMQTDVQAQYVGN